ncbi:MAG: prepilin-type N-terminal cleavage/methylation domain-containing protein [Terrimicrobiaceae bacterium]
MTSPANASRTPAFTLVELLAVIAIIAIMTALVVGVSPNVLQSQESVQCAGNLRQISMLLQSYAMDNDGCLVAPLNGSSWWSVLGKRENPKYDTRNLADNKIFLCPAAKHTYPNGNALRTYGMNAESHGLTESVRLVSNSHPARTLFVIDQQSNVSDPLDTYVHFRATASPLFSQYVDRRHQGKFNGLFLDGHVESLLPDDPGIPQMIRNFGK